MNIKKLLQTAREIWGDEKLTLPEIIIRLGKVYGDLCRYARNAPKDTQTHTDMELKKELGNIIFSTIRWINDLGFNPEDCIKLAIKTQIKYTIENPTQPTT